MLNKNWSTFWAMVHKELTVMVRYPVEFVASFGQVFLMVAVFTFGARTFSAQMSDNSAGIRSHVSYASGIVVYGFVLFMFVSDTLWTIGYNIRNEQVQGTLEQLYMSPASKFLNLVARVTNTLIWTGLLSLTAGALMVTMIGRLPVENPLLGLYILIMSLSGTFGVGFAFASLTLRVKETAQTVANFLQFGLLILCANFFPFSVLPPIVRFFSHIIPLAYCVDAFRSVMMGFPAGFPELASFQVEFVIVSLFGVLMPILGYDLYRRAERHARQTGSLGAY
jgi:ABC-2 type transport system permease protein